jgi:PadR family transcriptional regulator PadR
LEQQKYVKTYNTTYNSRLRKYYQITKLGREKLEESKADFYEIKALYDFILR